MHWEKLVLVLNHLIQAAVMVLGIYVALTRIPDNKHHWSDVLAGSLLGFGIALVLVRNVQKTFSNKFYNGRTMRYRYGIAQIYAAVNVNSVPQFDVELTANPEEPNIFSPSIFWRIPGY
jgi:hypothetical protein